MIFFDIEADINSKKIREMGLVFKDLELKTSSLKEVIDFLSATKSNFIVGHNFIDYDLQLLKNTTLNNLENFYNIIDTLPLSLLFFSEKTLHSLPKDYKSEDNFENNPVEDSKITTILFNKILERFHTLPNNTKNIFFSLLHDNLYFKGFFEYIQIDNSLDLIDSDRLFLLIREEHSKTIVDFEYLKELLTNNKFELAYIIALITPYIEIKSHPPKILFSYPNIVEIQKKLCYSSKNSINRLLDYSKEIFGISSFREFPRLNANLLDSQSVSQKQIIEASLNNESFLAILPTGGGKTFCFWLPAVIKSSAYKSLTVVISPLQALIEDHIKSFQQKVANYKAVAISGFMSPLERNEAVEKVINGEADILYIAPESLRSNTIFKILKNRLIERFVIDEAHCLSTWGNDFRQDYYYICEFIKDLLKEKPYQKNIPISCFTATAKPSVIKDIEDYFYTGLNIELSKYLAVPERKNLQYKSISTNSENKYNELLNLIKSHNGSTLVYIPTSTSKCDDTAKKLAIDTGKVVKSFHSKIDSPEKMKILKEYIDNEIDVIVATTAFGMGVDKPNITNVIHYEISDSLENYSQEAGRGARDEKLNATCPILFDENDLDKHFSTLTRTKLTASEINSIFMVIKKSKGEVLYKTSFELAKEAGWDIEDNKEDYRTKVKTVLLELEREGYINRGRNKTSFFADSIASKSMEKLHDKLEKSNYSEDDKQKLILVMQNILGRGKPEAVQVDELAYLLGYDKTTLIVAINRLKEFGLLGESKDLSLEIFKNSLQIFKNIKEIELLIFQHLDSLFSNRVLIRDLNELLFVNNKIDNNSTPLIKSIIKTWVDKSHFIFKRLNREQDLWHFEFLNKKGIYLKINKYHKISDDILKYFYKSIEFEKNKNEIFFSLQELKDVLNNQYKIEEIDKTLLYLHHLEVIKLLRGRFINYSPMEIKKEQKTQTKRKYTINEYKNRLDLYYQTKIESIHIMGEYAKRLKDDSYKAKQFLTDYFTLSYKLFKNKYKLLKEKISKPITQKRYNKIFEQMQSNQKLIIQDTTTKAMMILAGPGSGKTKVLVHKIASLILTEDIKPEQFMMLTFSKTAKLEFKSRLYELMGMLSYEVEIQTFHSYALKLIARVVNGSEEILKESIKEATKSINEGKILLPHIAVLVLDEYQDINEESFEFIKAIYKSNDDMKVIAVGDDDQCIMEFNGSKVEFIDKFKEEFRDIEDDTSYKQYELLCNFRSKQNIVKYTNSFSTQISNRYKIDPLYAHSKDKGLVNLFGFKTTNLELPLLNMIKLEDKNQTIAVLAKTNEDVINIYSLFQENNIEARYIIDRDKFKLKNIEEIVFFDEVLQTFLEDKFSFKELHFEKSLNILKQRFSNSNNLGLVFQIVDRFLNDFAEDYNIGSWIAYLEELKLEDFLKFKRNIIVSTIHKSKGLEFDKVYLIANGFKNIDLDKRVLYVGMTRAKSELNILKTEKTRDEVKDFVNYIYDDKEYINSSKRFTHIMSLSDIKLGYDFTKYSKVDNLFAQVELEIDKKNSEYCLKYNNKIIAFFSKKFNKLISEKFDNGYKLKSCLLEYMVLWYDKENKKRVKHPLCKIVLERSF
ncbi:RecQ family ATP-dependent DNA helicase [Aliarcobacter skirrowii]|uniref:DNA 3'-5' helicase n=7 Tax=Aliarcobacter skirrowii TaxID=28200 RepID=A0A2U2BZN3_9BACT|nr:RecQ family ATP-dependent DNA helicase [Aliarcobacter skirrowii]PWE20303.1 RecQ family ATP-dependent DNA helicase [Aliarcobacter skirrowii]PWE20890.1 RecQ family ATP-dependent DNA helicase [Aliarcobacter skirrowii]RJO55636.1 RecQ family ATP-dependent DNA helicase [Aliarcobacter skirrowii]RJO57591.1 RecQ family ATP-dependent DNA helicase [Aliarcobacter skirrowii]